MRQRNQTATDVLARRGRGLGVLRRGGLGLILGLAMLGGCDLGIDPDSLVREMRILGMRAVAGDPAAAGPTSADLQAEAVLSANGLDVAFTSSSLTLSALVVEPTGTGRRIAAPRTLQYDWFVCIGLGSQYSPGTLDADCRKWQPTDPDPKANSALLPLNGAGTATAGKVASLTVPTEVLRGPIAPFLLPALIRASQSDPPDMAGQEPFDMAGPPIPKKPLVVLLPIILRASVVGSDLTDNRNSEVGFSYLRVVVGSALLGLPLPPPNQNPQLIPAQVGPQSDGAMQTLLPCPADGTSCPPYQLPRAAQAFISGLTTEASVETYTPLDARKPVPTPEILRFSWFSTDGEFSELRTGTMRPQTRWKSPEKYAAPADVTTVRVWVVVQDGRNGADWAEYNLQLQ